MAETNPKLPKVLVVEDDIFMVDLISQALKSDEYTLLLAKNGTEGIEKCQAEHPNLVLLDIILPDQNGFDVLRQIRQMEGGNEIQVIVFSNLSEQNQKDEATRLGAIDYMIKANTSLPEITEKVKSVLESQRK